MCEIELPPLPKPWSVYLVRAANGALYCGISDDPVRRFAKHQSGKGARFFASSPAVALVYVETWPSKGEALRHERLIKRLRKSAKEVLVSSWQAVAQGACAGEDVSGAVPLGGAAVSPQPMVITGIDAAP